MPKSADICYVQVCLLKSNDISQRCFKWNEI